jgi:hypothetical protein
MSFSTIIKSGLSILLDNPIIVEGAQKKEGLQNQTNLTVSIVRTLITKDYKDCKDCLINRLF